MRWPSCDEYFELVGALLRGRVKEKKGEDMKRRERAQEEAEEGETRQEVNIRERSSRERRLGNRN